MNIKRSLFLAVAILALATIPVTRADEVDDLIETILEASPKERAKVEKHEALKAKKKSPTKKISSAKSKPLVPDLGIPDDQVFDAAAKFPKDIVGKYIYGPVTLKSIFNQNGEAEISLTAKNMRSFQLYTRDPDVVAAFNGGWGARYTIPRSCPLRIVGIKMPGMYSVRLPYDPDRTAYTMQEHFHKGTQGIMGDFQERMQRATEKFEDALQQ